jgi:hypothetical protein
MTKSVTGILLLCLVSVALFATLHSFKPVKAVASAELLPTHYGFYTPPPTGQYGVFSVVGEVRNNGTEPLNINVSVSFLDRQGIPFGQPSTVQTLIKCVLPGEKAPFRLALSDQNAPNVVSYTKPVITTTIASSARQLNLQILNSTFYSSQDRFVKSPGIVKNNGSSSATNANAIITYYDKTSGNITWATKTLLENQNITSGAVSRFELSSSPLNTTKLPLDKCSFAVVVESDEYLSPVFTNLQQDKIDPLFVEVKLFPNPPTSTQIVSVNATVTKPDYASKVTKALFYYNVGGGAWMEVNMTASGNTWRTPNLNPIGPFGAGQTVQYYIDAYDAAGNKATYPLSSFAVQQGQSSGVPIEYVLITFIALILLIVIYKYRKRIF